MWPAHVLLEHCIWMTLASMHGCTHGLSLRMGSQIEPKIRASLS